MMRGFIGLGSNIEPRIAHLRTAVQKINEIPCTCVTRISSVYETEPVGVSEPQGWYLNAVVEIETELSPLSLLHALEAIECELGRCLHTKGMNAPRTIDLDLLLLNDIQIETERLILPHPRMCERAFVLVPLCELAPNLQLPDGAHIKERAQQLAKVQRIVRRYAPDEWLRQ